MTVGQMQITLGEHGGQRKTRQDSSSLGTAARRLTLSRYVARLKPRCGSLALSVMWYVPTVSQVGAMARLLDLSEISYPSISTAKATRCKKKVECHASGTPLTAD